MKAKHILSLIQKNYTTIAVQYQPEGTLYVFKALLEDKITEGDLVVLPASSKWGFAIGKVVAVHARPQIDTSATWDYKWIAGKIDLNRFNIINEVEARWEERIRDIEREKVQRTMVTEFIEQFPVGTQERNELDQLMSGATSIDSLATLLNKPEGDTPNDESGKA